MFWNGTSASPNLPGRPAGRKRFSLASSNGNYGRANTILA